MTEFYVTFGVQYEDGSHPRAWVHPDGYLTIEADDYSTARHAAFTLLDNNFAFIYEEKLDSNTFPLGELHRIKIKEPNA